jgi:hypothetical protein
MGSCEGLSVLQGLLSCKLLAIFPDTGKNVFLGLVRNSTEERAGKEPSGKEDRERKGCEKTKKRMI